MSLPHDMHLSPPPFSISMRLLLASGFIAHRPDPGAAISGLVSIFDSLNSTGMPPALRDRREPTTDGRGYGQRETGRRWEDEMFEQRKQALTAEELIAWKGDTS